MPVAAMAHLRRDEAPRPPSPGRARARTPLARLLVALVVSVIVGVVLEVGVFNLGHWATLGASPQELVPTGTVTVDGREAQTYDPVDGISRVEVQASYASSERQLFHVAFYAADEGSSTLHELGETLMYPGKELTCIKELHFFGEPSQIAVAVWLEGAVDTETADQYPDAAIDSVTVTADPHVPYDTSPVRLCLVTAVVLLALAVRRGGPLDLPSEEHPRLLRGAVLALVAGALVASAAMFLSKPLFTSVATPTYNAHRSTGEAVNSFEAFDRSLRYGTERYYEQARALAAGRASLLIDPPDWLEEMENPYDPVARDVKAAETGEDYLWDVAYYDGGYYVYFGILPTVVFYLPFYLLTGGAFPCGVAVFISVCALEAGIAALLMSVRRHWFPGVSVSSFVLVLLGTLLSSSLVTALGRAEQYELPMVMGLACVVWGLWALVRATYGRGRELPWFAASGLLLSLTMASRPQLGVALLALVPAAAHLARTRRLTPGKVACTALPIVLVAALLMTYNYVRFDSPFDFGASYNLTANDMTSRTVSAALVLQGAFAYLLQPLNLGGSYPYLLPATSSTDYVGVVVTEPTFGGALALYPFLAAGALLLALMPRERGRVAWPLGLFAAGCAIAVFDAAGSGVLGRYQLDFCLFLAFGAALVFLGLLDGRGEKSVGPVLARRALVLGVGLTIVTTVLLVFAFHGLDGGLTVAANQFYANVWAELAGSFSMR